MAHVGQIGVFILATVIANTSLISCSRCTSSVDEDRSRSQSSSNALAAYDIVSRRLQLLNTLRVSNTGIVPCIPGRKPAIEVDVDLRIHALRTEPVRQAYDENDDALVPVLYGVIDTDSPPQWRKVTEIYRPESPVLLLDGAQTTGAILGTTTFKKHIAAGAVLVFPLDSTRRSTPASCVESAAAEVRMTSDGNGNLLMVSHEDYEPIEDRYAAGLRVIRCHDGVGEVLASQIPGTLHERTFPRDYAIYAGAIGQIYVVYEGVRSEAEQDGPQLWRLTLDSSGKLLESKALAKGTGSTYALRIIAAPDAQLHAFELYGSRASSDMRSNKLDHRIVPLGVMGRSKGVALNFVVDPWIQAHAIWFENNEPKHHGPETIPP